MIDLLGIFTLWCLHNFDNNRSNNFDENKREPIQFFLNIEIPDDIFVRHIHFVVFS